MRTLLLNGVAFAALLTGSAMASPVVSWAGLYVGGNFGGSWGNSSNDWNFVASDSTSNIACPPAGFAICLVSSDSNQLLRGAIGGLEAGYNWQIANYVFGIETDVEISGLKGSHTLDNSTPPLRIPVGSASLSAAYTEQLQWLGTLRGRVGYVAGGLLIYGTAGLAYGQVSMNGSATVDGTFTGNPGGNVLCSGANLFTTVGSCPFASWSNKDMRVGWTLGAGVEGALFGNWTAKIEYLHVDLGNVATTFATDGVCYSGTANICIPLFPGQGSINSRITGDIIRLGLNYKFNLLRP
jgi:outer membrane immunogenic protein